MSTGDNLGEERQEAKLEMKLNQTTLIRIDQRTDLSKFHVILIINRRFQRSSGGGY